MSPVPAGETAMRRALLLLCLLPLSSLAAPAPGAPATAATTRSGPPCLDPAFVRSWKSVDDRTLLVDAGSRHYRISLLNDCPTLSIASELRLRGDNITGRLCGFVGETVQVRNEVCRVQRIDLIDAETYRQQGKRKAAAAKPDQPERPPEAKN